MKQEFQHIKNTSRSINNGKLCIWEHPVLLIIIAFCLFLVYSFISFLYQELALRGFGDFEQTLFSLLLLICIVGGSLMYATRTQHHFIKTRWYGAKGAIYIFVGIFVCIALAFGAQYLIKTFAHLSAAVQTTTNQKTIFLLLHSGTGSFIWMMLSGMILGPVMEEIIFHFLIIGPRTFKGHERNKAVYYALIATSCVLFMYAHLGKILFTTSSWTTLAGGMTLLSQVIQYGLVTALLTYVYVETSDIRMSIGAHIGYNAVSTIVNAISVALL